MKKIGVLFGALIMLLTLASCSGKMEMSIQSSNEYGTKEAVVFPVDGLDNNVAYFRVMTYNVSNCELGKEIDAVAKDIEDSKADVILLQELDYYVRRSDNQDVLKALADKLKMNYAFYPAIQLNNGLYGVGILSAYPLSEVKSSQLEANGHEGRVFASASIDVAGKSISLFNTHLSYEEESVRKNQLDYAAAEIAKKDSFILGGDFNVSEFEEFSVFQKIDMVNFPTHPFDTYIGSDEGFRAIDNIIVSNDIRIIYREMLQTSVSDHNPLVADIEFDVM